MSSEHTITKLEAVRSLDSLACRAKRWKTQKQKLYGSAVVNYLPPRQENMQKLEATALAEGHCA